MSVKVKASIERQVKAIESNIAKLQASALALKAVASSIPDNAPKLAQPKKDKPVKEAAKPKAEVKAQKSDKADKADSKTKADVQKSDKAVKADSKLKTDKKSDKSGRPQAAS